MAERMTLVLGAGASRPYGFPVGKELVDRICTEFPGIVQQFNIDWAAAHNVNIRPDDFCRILHDSSLPSIDQLLARRKELREVGRLAIASVLLQCERTTYLSNLSKNNSDNWYQRLFDWLAKDCIEPQAFPAHIISIITFNYDRSLEQYLFRALRSAYGISDALAADRIRRVPIVHVYGSFGALPWQHTDGTVLDYDCRCDWDTIVKGAQGITHPFDQQGTSTVRQAIEAAMDSTDAVLFLGFGYHPVNLKILRLASSCRKRVDIQGTCFGSNDSERGGILARLAAEHPSASIGELLPCTNVEFMRRTGWFHM